MSADVTLDTTNLDKLLKALGDNMPVARVGILGASTARSSTGKPGLTNAEIGARHEFGEGSMPQRSFLRTPIIEELPLALEKAGAFDADVLKNVIQERSVFPWLQEIAAVAKGVVIGAFATGGYGKWKPSNMANKKNHQTLVETQQLRDSITYEVKK